ncbi:hypothetical protein AAZX31_09G111100 [Glycine max]|uniref:Putative fasciclin-like arabinogalactan protein 20 n=1 Tax=Glycine soja TaxID=3848 RepID=A0A445J005_GLYSO|nr:putative fasciclin-like arabinogalactan protein 20 [Glycine soja]KAG4991321.1 hypothetical protein JHK87_024778 [Glycine soja]KAG5006908.1 hypothetical protein JHK85_025450 [Glycine max]RZB91723.1 putative fasciclin-like arabinogalactan protein 20 [Glycine soja]
MASTTTTTFLILSFSLLLLLSVTAASPLLEAANILSAAGYECMALQLELASQTLQSHHSLTIFAPSDAAFEHHHHHPSLHLLRYHLLPHAFSLHSLTSLPFGASIPTLLPSHSLTVTTTNPHSISINNVSLNTTPIFQHPNLTIFSAHTFFNPHFHFQHQNPTPPPNPATCPPPLKTPLSHASHLLHSRNFSVVAAVLNLQFPAPCTGRELTLFAPPDNAITHLNLTELVPLLHRHLVPCKIAWRDLAALQDGTLIGTYERGFAINVTNTNTLLLNGVHVTFPEMYRGDWLVVHGVNHVLSGTHHGKRHPTHRAKKNDSYRVSVEEEQDGGDQESSSGFEDHRHREGEENSPHHYHFSAFH